MFVFQKIKNGSDLKNLHSENGLDLKLFLLNLFFLHFILYISIFILSLHINYKYFFEDKHVFALFRKNSQSNVFRLKSSRV